MITCRDIIILLTMAQSACSTIILNCHCQHIYVWKNWKSMQSSHCQWKLNGQLFVQVSKYLNEVCLTHDISLHQWNTQDCISQVGTHNPHRISDNFSICQQHHFAINGLAPLTSIYPDGNPQSLSTLWQRAYTTPLELISTTHYIEIWKVSKTLIIGVDCYL